VQQPDLQAGVKSALRVLDIFELLAQHPEGLNLSEIAAALGIPKSSAHSLIYTLLARHYLREGWHDRKYHLGPRLFEIGSGYAASTDLLADGQEVVRATARACDETVHLAILDGAEVVYVAKEEGTNTVRMVSAVGRRFPAYGTGVGKMLLSNLPPGELDNLYPPEAVLPPITTTTITDPAAFRRELALTHTRGYALDCEESTPGLCCIAAPVYGKDGDMVAAISVSVPTVRFTPERQNELRMLVQANARKLSEILGYYERSV
jgi:DNA-binding IclR family transcriptional regulator